MSDRIITVFGATGAQGGGLARAILAAPQAGFVARAVSRKPGSAAARALAAAGAELVQADLDELDSVRVAMEGAHGVFAVTNFWEHHSPERELAQAANLADAARDAKVSHLIWSTLEDTRRWVPIDDERIPTLMGRYKVPHFDSKGQANVLFAESGVPTTLLHTSFYWENLLRGMGLQRSPAGELVLLLPMGDRPLPGIAVDDIGACALALFRRGERAIGGRSVGVAGGHPTGAQMAQSLSRALGEPVRYRTMPFGEYARLGFPGSADIANMFQFKHDFNEAYCAARPVETTRALHPGLLDFDRWVDTHRDQLVAAVGVSAPAEGAQ